MNKNEITKIDNNKKIKQSNRLIEARYNLTKYEQRMMIAICSQLNSNAEEFNKVRVKVKDMADFCHFEPNKAWNHVKATIMRLATRTLQIKNSDGSWYVTHWLQSAKYIPSSGIVEYKIDEELKTELLQLKSAYLATPAEPLMEFSRDYSVRMYFILKKMLKIRDFEKDIDFFRDRFQLGKSYELFANLKNKVIEPALAEINAKSDITVWHEYIKEGRAYKKIHFIVDLKEAETEDKDIEYIYEKVAGVENYFALPEDLDISEWTPEEPEKGEEPPANPNTKKGSAPAPAEIVTEPADETNWNDEQQADYDALIRQDVWVSRAKQIVDIYDHERIKRNLEGVLRDKLKGTIANTPAVIVSAIHDDSYKGIAEEKAKAKERVEEKKREEWDKSQREAKEKEEKRQKEDEKLTELVKIRTNRTKEELIAVFEQVSAEYRNNNKILTTEMLSKLEENGISQRDFSSYQGTVARKTIKYIQ